MTVSDMPLLSVARAERRKLNEKVELAPAEQVEVRPLTVQLATALSAVPLTVRVAAESVQF